MHRFWPVEKSVHDPVDKRRPTRLRSLRRRGLLSADFEEMIMAARWGLGGRVWSVRCEADNRLIEIRWAGVPLCDPLQHH